MSTRTQIIVALLLACVYTLLLNTGTLQAMWNGKLELAHMGIRTGSIDEAHTFALMQEVAEGHFRLGSASLREHRDSGVGLTYGPLLQGVLLRITKWNIQTVVLAGDLLFPLLITLIFFAIFLRVYPPIFAVCIAIVAMNAIGAGWLRSINPQITFFFFSAYLYLYFGKSSSRRNSIIRGLILLVMIPVHIHYALYGLAIEVCNGCRTLWQNRSKAYLTLSNISWALLPVIIGFIIRLSINPPNGFSDTAADMERRLGLIPSHLPAAPVLQITIMAVCSILFFVWKRHQTDKSERIFMLKILIMLLAGMIVLNQSVIHGRDAIFVVYYSPILHVTIWIAVTAAVLSCTNNLLSRVALITTIAIITTLGTLQDLRGLWQDQRSSTFPNPETLAVIRQLVTIPGERVILAPLNIADLIPVLTHHYVLFNRYSRFGNGSDREIAERYMLVRSLFPDSSATLDTTYGLVFGQYAGNIAARERTLCTIIALIKPPSTPCEARIRSKIYHQDVLTLLDEAVVDREKLLKVYNVDILITQGDPPHDLLPHCTPFDRVNGYTLASCSHSLP